MIGVGDLWGLIFSFLNSFDLLSCELTCHEWKKLAAEAFGIIRQSSEIRHLCFHRKRRGGQFLSDKHFCYKWLIRKPKGFLVIGTSFGEEENENFVFNQKGNNKIEFGFFSNEWNMPIQGVGSTTVIENINGSLEMYGGWNQIEEKALNKSFKLDTSYNITDPHSFHTWEVQNNIPLSLCFASSSSKIGGEVILTGGSSTPYRDSEVFKSCYIRREVDDACPWTSLPDMLHKRCGHSNLVNFNDDILSIGGYGGGMTYYSSCEIFNSKSETWSMLPEMKLARSGFASCVDGNNCVLVAGGSPDGLDSHRSLVRFDLRSGKWYELAPMKEARGYTSGCVGKNGFFYVLGGLSPSHRFVDSVEVYDPRANAWTLLSYRETLSAESRRNVTEALLNVAMINQMSENLSRACHQIKLL